MAEYLAQARLGKHEWQIINQVGNHEFVCDDTEHDAGPNPVEYLCGAVDSCITMSAGMIIKEHHLAVTDFRLRNKAETRALGHGESVVAEMKLKISFKTSMPRTEQKKLLSHILRVSTVYMTLAQAIKITVDLA